MRETYCRLEGAGDRSTNICLLHAPVQKATTNGMYGSLVTVDEEACSEDMQLLRVSFTSEVCTKATIRELFKGYIFSRSINLTDIGRL